MLSSFFNIDYTFFIIYGDQHGLARWTPGGHFAFCSFFFHLHPRINIVFNKAVRGAPFSSTLLRFEIASN